VWSMKVLRQSKCNRASTDGLGALRSMQVWRWAANHSPASEEGIEGPEACGGAQARTRRMAQEVQSWPESSRALDLRSTGIVSPSNPQTLVFTDVLPRHGARVGIGTQQPGR